jgi:hypothetical protein
MRAWVLPLLCAGCSELISFEPVTYRADAAALTPKGACPSNATCQDFSGDIAAPWAIDTNGGTAQVTLESGALHVKIPQAGVGSGLIAFTGTELASNSKLFLRFRAQLSQTLANASLVEVRHDDRAKSGGVSLKVSDGKLAYNVTSAALETTASQVATEPLPTGSFTCLVLALEIGTAGHVKAERDGKVVLDGAADTLAGETSWNAVWIGLPFVDAPAGGADVIIDDIAVSQTAVSCD